MILACFLLGLTLIIVRRIAGGGFILVPRRWVVERSFGWIVPRDVVSEEGSCSSAR